MFNGSTRMCSDQWWSSEIQRRRRITMDLTRSKFNSIPLSGTVWTLEASGRRGSPRAGAPIGTISLQSNSINKTAPVLFIQHLADPESQMNVHLGKIHGDSLELSSEEQSKGNAVIGCKLIRRVTDQTCEICYQNYST